MPVISLARAFGWLTHLEARHSPKRRKSSSCTGSAAVAASASNISACRRQARSQVGCRLIVASRANNSRPACPATRGVLRALTFSMNAATSPLAAPASPVFNALRLSGPATHLPSVRIRRICGLAGGAARATPPACQRNSDQMQQRQGWHRVEASNEKAKPMSAITKTIWLIESRTAELLTLDDLASHAGVSRSHLSRIFPLATGYSISAYLRGRRLTEAAKALAG